MRVHMIRKTRLHKVAGLFLVLSMCVQLSVQAQSHEFRHVSPRDGLPSGFIWTITQDSKGFIWIGTNEGLGKHDGYATIAYRSDAQDSTTLSGGNVYDIIEYDETTFFLATSDGLDLFNPVTEVFNRISVPDSIPDPVAVRDLLLLDEHNMWAGAGSGLFHVDPATLRDENPKVKFYGLPGLQENQAANITALAADSLKNLWVGTDSNLFKFDLETNEFTDMDPVTDGAANVIQGTIWSMLYTSGKDLLITSETGLAMLRDGERVIEEIKQLGEYNTRDLRAAYFQSITEDSDGNIWLGTGLMGAIRWNPETGESVAFRASADSRNTISSDDVHYAFEDDNGNIWFGYHYEGVSIMYDDSWNYEMHVPFPDLPSTDLRNTITNAKMDENGMLWATVANGLIRDLGGENQEFFHFDTSAYESIGENQALQRIFTIHDNKVYLGSFSPGFQTGYIVFDQEKEGGQFTVLLIPNGLQISPGTAIRFGDVAFNGLYHANSIIRTDLSSGEIEVIDLPVAGEYENFLTVSSPHFVHENEVYAPVYFLDTQSDYWEVEPFIMNLETEEIRVHDIVVDYPIQGLQPPLVSSYEQGIVYLNATGGLIRVDNLNNSYLVLFRDQMSLIREGSLLMAEDEDGYIWLNNLTGLTRLDPLTEELDYFEVPREQYVPIRAYPSTLSNGEIIFPGNGSYIRFNPADLRSTQPAGETLITSLRAGPKIFELIYSSEKPQIESSQNTLTLHFMGLDLRDPASIHYRYRILGSENEQWTVVGTQRSVFVPNLPAGDYAFEVQSGSQVGTFAGQTASLDFTILPPWWNTIPAYVMYLLLFGGLVAGIDRIQRRRVIQKERERTREKELEQAREIEKAYKNLEVAHEDLKAAQEQLVQQEKLASLGQLTAGIAHEIKNPLNFVNNFSEVSLELVEEAREEVKRARDHDLILEILNDIKSNLSKIYEHGSRADSIVKSMLQHSRGGEGKMEPTPLNPLIKEYVNLSFHGMRAGKDPINVDIDLQLDESIGEVPMIGEDFSRVIVNLCNNAFDAMRSMFRMSDSSASEGYQPKLTIRTKQEPGKVILEIEDNGPGIPEEIRDKILQPFFTTKKGTQGTGLGLSITNDIIKAHGGEMEIASRPGQTRFHIEIKSNKSA
ncbi:MAG: GHKL domain-containing protein [Balneolaceae bacterium]|nr:MAG: GHKL domain-containing protein [Balneolaceae bacterium]